MKKLQYISLLGLSAAVVFSAGCSTKKNSAGVNGSGVGYANSVAGGVVNSPSYAAAEGGQIVGQDMAAVAANNIVYFDYDSSAIKPSEYGKLNQHVQMLSANANERVLLAGHADERGTREYNAALGERRASSVKDYLTTNGVDANQIDTVSYGEERPVGSYDQNRRVEFNYNR